MLAKAFKTFLLNVSFRRSIIGPRQTSWNDLLHLMDSVYLMHVSDAFRWNLTVNGILSAASFYNALIQPDVLVDNNKKVWKMRTPLKTKMVE
jgi:hypothetical protein